MGLSIKVQDFSATAELDHGKLLTTLVGNADQGVREALDDFLCKVHDEASSHSVHEVVVDLRSVEFMNSGCLKAFVTWIFVARELPSGARYKIVLLSHPDILWQRRSVQALSCVATDLVKIQA